MKNKITSRVRVSLTVTLICTSIFSAVFVRAAPTYEHDIAPILRTYCVGCHNSTNAEGQFSLETYALLRRGGESLGDPIIPHNSNASKLLARLHSTDEDHMPPKTEPQLPPEAISKLQGWINAGAHGPTIDRSIRELMQTPYVPPYTGQKPITAMAYSPTGSVAVGREHVVDIFRDTQAFLQNTPTLKHFSHTVGTVMAAHYDAVGSRLVLAGGVPGVRGVAEVIDLHSNTSLLTLADHSDLLYDAEFSPDGSLLATAGYDRSLKVWNVADGSLFWENTIHNAAIFDLEWHPSGEILASASADETVKIWRTSDGIRLDTLSQPQGEVLCLQFSNDGQRLFAAGQDKRIYAWKISSLKTPAINPVILSCFAHEASITVISISPQGDHLISAAEDGSLTRWRLPDLMPDHNFANQGDVVSVMCETEKGLLLGLLDGTTRMVDIRQPPNTKPTSVDMPDMVRSAALQRNSPTTKTTEEEDNDMPSQAQRIQWPAVITGDIQRHGDADCFRFHAKRGEPILFEVDAAQSQSKLDSKIEILDGDGNQLTRLVLQATRDSWFTFRGKDSSQSNDFRVHNWREMELDEYLFAGGEVVRLWFYPRGPDSGFNVYPGFGKRHTFFDTTSVTHALNEPAWIVRPLPVGTNPSPNGLPSFPIYWENDDESQNRLGVDSQLIFTPPKTGEYIVRITDTRGFGGTTDLPSNYHYSLTARLPRPSFSISVGGKNPKVGRGGSQETTFTAERIEGYSGPIRIEVNNLPTGLMFHGPIEIEEDQFRAVG
ncbi:MAG: c-type cytochrome domain-containing protein, partial [Pirellulales bacterium]